MARLRRTDAAVHRLTRMGTSPHVSTPHARAGWPGAATVLLLLLAILWRLPYALTRTYTEADELWYSLPTAERMARGEWLFYISGTDYGAPVQEFFSSLLIRLFGVNLATLRLPVVILSAFAVAVAYLNLRTVVRERIAFVLCLPLACGNSAILHYTAFAHPCYATTFLLAGVIQLLTFRVARNRTTANWLALALAMGTGFYVFKLSLLQSAGSLAWLWWRSESAAGLRERATGADGARRLRFAAGVLAAGAALLAPVAYHWLTRRQTFVAAPWEKIVVLTAFSLLLAGAAVFSRLLPRPTWREVWPVLTCALALVLIPLPAAVWHAHIEAPRHAAHGPGPYAEASYSLKHVQAWPHQVRLVIQGIIPALVIGRVDTLKGEPTETEPFDWRAGMSVALLAALAWFGGKRLRSSGWRVPLRAGDAVIVAPFLLTAAVMFPSWALHSEWCFRYLLPFLPGGLLLADRALENPIARSPRIALFVLAALLAQNAYDCYRHLN